MKSGKLDKPLTALQSVIAALTSVKDEERLWVLRSAIDKLGMDFAGLPQVRTPAGAPTPPPPGTPAGSGGGAPAPNVFMAEKRAQKDVDRATCLAYYLTHHRQTGTFKTRELTTLNHEARGRAFSNIAVAVNNARQAGYLAPAGQGKKRITDRGEALVEALPDAARVKEALDAHPIRRRGGKRKKAKGAK